MGYFNRIKLYFKAQTTEKDFEPEKPENWVLGIFYLNSKDFRFIVPKRNPTMGWTFNFAHPIAYIVLIMIFLIAMATSLIHK